MRRHGMLAFAFSLLAGSLASLGPATASPLSQPSSAAVVAPMSEALVDTVQHGQWSHGPSRHHGHRPHHRAPRVHHGRHGHRHGHWRGREVCRNVVRHGRLVRSCHWVR